MQVYIWWLWSLSKSSFLKHLTSNSTNKRQHNHQTRCPFRCNEPADNVIKNKPQERHLKMILDRIVTSLVADRFKLVGDFVCFDNNTWKWQKSENRKQKRVGYILQKHQRKMADILELILFCETGIYLNNTVYCQNKTKYRQFKI